MTTHDARGRGLTYYDPAVAHTALIERVPICQTISDWRALPDDRVVMWSGIISQLTVYDAAARTSAFCIGHTDYVREVCALRDGRLMSWAEDGTVRLWRVDGTPLAVMGGHAPWCDAFELADGRLLSSDLDVRTDLYGPIRLWTAEGAPLGLLPNSNGLIFIDELALGRVVLSEPRWDGRRFIQEVDGTRIGTLEFYPDGTYNFLALPDGRFLTIGEEIRLWDADGASSIVLDSAQPHHGHRAIALADGRLLSMRYTGEGRPDPGDSLTLWSPDGRLIRVFPDHPWSVKDALVLRNGRMVTWGWSDPLLRLWSAEGDLIAVMEGHRADDRTVFEMPNGMIVSHAWPCMGEAAEESDSLRMWNGDGQPIAALFVDSSFPRSITLSDGRLLILTSDERGRLQVCVWQF